MSIMKVDRKKVLALTDVLREAVEKHLDKTPMIAAEIQLALTQMIYYVGGTASEIEIGKALREKPRVAA